MCEDEVGKERDRILKGIGKIRKVMGDVALSDYHNGYLQALKDVEVVING